MLPSQLLALTQVSMRMACLVQGLLVLHCSLGQVGHSVGYADTHYYHQEAAHHGQWQQCTCSRASSQGLACGTSSLVTQLTDSLGRCSEEGQMCFKASWHVFVHSCAVFPHAVISHACAQHGMPGPVPQ